MREKFHNSSGDVMKTNFLPLYFILILCFLTISDTSFGQQVHSSDGEHFSGIDSTNSSDNGSEIDSFVDELIQQIQSEAERIVQQTEPPHYENRWDSSAAGPIADGALTFTGDTRIDVADSICGNVVVKGGTLTVAGIVNGDALAIDGNIIVESGGKITGNARAINGKVVKNNGGIVEGYSEERSSLEETRYDEIFSRPRSPYTFNDYWLDEHMLSDNLLFRYNRVEGLFLGIGSKKKFNWDGDKKISGYGSAGYGFAIHRWSLNLGIDWQFARHDDILWEVGGEGHSFTDTKDEWIMKLWENNLASLFWHEDYRDYFFRQGFSAHVARYSKQSDLSTQIRIQYGIDRYSSLGQLTNWSLFRQGSSFRENPPVSDGIMHSILVTAGASTLEERHHQSVGWNAFLSGEVGGNSLGGDFNFKELIADVRRFQPLSEYDNVNIRVRVGSLEGDYLEQRSFEIGGANTLPGYGFKEFAGNRLILGNFEYVISGRLLDDIALWPQAFNFIAFTDAGATALVPTGKNIAGGFDQITNNPIKSDVGFAVGWHDDGWRLGFAWPTDHSASAIVFLRLNKPF
jgi:hypothetical protein